MMQKNGIHATCSYSVEQITWGKLLNFARAVVPFQLGNEYFSLCLTQKILKKKTKQPTIVMLLPVNRKFPRNRLNY